MENVAEPVIGSDKATKDVQIALSGLITKDPLQKNQITYILEMVPSKHHLKEDKENDNYNGSD